MLAAFRYHLGTQMGTQGVKTYKHNCTPLKHWFLCCDPFQAWTRFLKCCPTSNWFHTCLRPLCECLSNLISFLSQERRQLTTTSQTAFWLLANHITGLTELLLWRHLLKCQLKRVLNFTFTQQHMLMDCQRQASGTEKTRVKEAALVASKLSDTGMILESVDSCFLSWSQHVSR